MSVRAAELACRKHCVRLDHVALVLNGEPHASQGFPRALRAAEDSFGSQLVELSAVRQLGGTFDIRSRDGAGTTFTLRLPQTLAVT